MKSVLVYCGSRSGNSDKYAKAAARLGELLAEKNYRLLFGGGNVGLMGVLSNAMLDRGGQVLGVMPRRLIDREIANSRCTELRVVNTMQERKALMEELADIIITLPGGYGSMDELFESLTNAQLDLHQKPVMILNTGGFYDALIMQLDRMVEEGFLLKENREKMQVARTPEELMAMLPA